MLSNEIHGLAAFDDLQARPAAPCEAQRQISDSAKYLTNGSAYHFKKLVPDVEQTRVEEVEQIQQIAQRKAEALEMMKAGAYGGAGTSIFVSIFAAIVGVAVSRS
jgi:hypothetical protein